GNEPPTSLFEVRSKRPAGMAQVFVPVRELDRATSAILNRAQLTDVYIGAAPRTRESGSAAAVESVSCLWVDADSPSAVARLWEFRPLPSIVVRSGTAGNRHGWWPLRQPISPAHAVRANRRLALAVGADRAATDAARIMRPVGSRNHK